MTSALFISAVHSNSVGLWCWVECWTSLSPSPPEASRDLHPISFSFLLLFFVSPVLSLLLRESRRTQTYEKVREKKRAEGRDRKNPEECDREKEGLRESEREKKAN